MCVRLRGLFGRKREKTDRRGYNREQEAREEVLGMKRAQRRMKDRTAADDQSGPGALL